MATAPAQFLPWSRHRLVSRIQIGAGWALARLRCPARPWIDWLDPVTKWLALNGYGFHECYLNWQITTARGARPHHLQGYERRAFDQGIGRCLWFVKGANVRPHHSEDPGICQRAAHMQAWC